MDLNVSHKHDKKGMTAMGEHTRPVKRVFSITEAAVYLGRTVWAVREMIWARKIPCVRDGRRILLDVGDLDAWVERNKMMYS